MQLQDPRRPTDADARARPSGDETVLSVRGTRFEYLVARRIPLSPRVVFIARLVRCSTDSLLTLCLFECEGGRPDSINSSCSASLRSYVEPGIVDGDASLAKGDAVLDDEAVPITRQPESGLSRGALSSPSSREAATMALEEGGRASPTAVVGALER